VVAAPDHLLFQTGDGNAFYAQRIDVRRRRMSGTAAPLFEHVTSPAGRPAVSTSTNGVMVARGPGATSFRMLQWTDRAGLAMDSVHVPDGFWMARSSTRPDRVALGGWQFALYDRSRGVTTVLLRNEGPRPSPFGSPVWAPGDTLIAFRSGDSDSLGIQVLDPRTGATRALGLPPEMRMAIPVDWSRDGRLLALILPPVGERMRREAWVYDIDTGEAQRLFVDPGHVGDIRFSPDGRWVAWQSLAQGGTDVYVRALHGGGAPLRVSPESGSRNPRWSADGRELYYQSTGTGALMVVSVRPEADPPFSAPRQLRALTSLVLVDYEPTPDGGFALHLQRGAEPAPTLVLDWTKLLQREAHERLRVSGLAFEEQIPNPSHVQSVADDSIRRITLEAEGHRPCSELVARQRPELLRRRSTAVHRQHAIDDAQRERGLQFVTVEAAGVNLELCGRRGDDLESLEFHGLLAGLLPPQPLRSTGRGVEHHRDGYRRVQQDELRFADGAQFESAS
jgi:hypothetical protein